MPESHQAENRSSATSAVVADDWTVLRLAEGETAETVTVPAGKIIVPLDGMAGASGRRWKRAPRRRRASGWPATSVAAALKDEARKFAVIAVDFPKFSDGRGYSIAYNLRARLGYQANCAPSATCCATSCSTCSGSASTPSTPRADRNIHDALKGCSIFRSNLSGFAG